MLYSGYGNLKGCKVPESNSARYRRLLESRALADDQVTLRRFAPSSASVIKEGI
jgi:hypothetical protein